MNVWSTITAELTDRAAGAHNEGDEATWCQLTALADVVSCTQRVTATEPAPPPADQPAAARVILIAAHRAMGRALIRVAEDPGARRVQAVDDGVERLLAQAVATLDALRQICHEGTLDQNAVGTVLRANAVLSEWTRGQLRHRADRLRSCHDLGDTLNFWCYPCAAGRPERCEFYDH